MLQNELVDDNPEQQYCLRWKYHQSNLQVMFAQLLERESFCDVTLACEGKTIRAHKIMLAACSTYFDDIFSNHEEKDSIVILKDMKFDDIKSIVEFIYKGEITVDNSQLNMLLTAAESLRIKGLTAISWRSEGAGAWKSVQTPPKQYTPVTQNNQQRKRKLKPDSRTSGSNKLACLSNQQQSDDYASENDGNTSAYGDITSESEDSKPPDPLSVSTPKDHFLNPSVLMSESPTIKTEKDLDSSTNSKNGDSMIETPIKPELLDTIKMTPYIQQGGCRPNFWTIASTKKVLDAIKNKEIEMKVAAKLLGVSYGTLYGRYREVYGCLKNPYKGPPFWVEPSSNEIISKIKKKQISMYQGAELLNMSVSSLQNALTANNKENEDDDAENDSEASKNSDITIVKKEIDVVDPLSCVNGNN